MLDSLKHLPGVKANRDDSFICPLNGVSSILGVSYGCWCRGKVAAYALTKLGYSREAAAMYSDYSPEEAIEFGQSLLAIAASLRAQRSRAKKKADAAGTNVSRTLAPERDVKLVHFTFKEARAAIKDAGNWYVKVGTIGSGVHAWS